MVSVIVRFLAVSSAASSIRRIRRLGTRQSRRPSEADAHVALVQLVPPAHEDPLVEPHEVADLVGRPLPVLGGEGVDGEPLDAELERALDGVEQGLLARGVALGAGQAPLLGPPPVAVHDDADVGGDPVRVDAVELHAAATVPPARFWVHAPA